MHTSEINGRFGTNSHATILVLEDYDGLKWYCVEGSPIVNQTEDPIEEGVHIDTLWDIDTFEVDRPINTIQELIDAVEN